MAIKNPCGDQFPYRVSISPTHPKIDKGIDRWWWLSQHVGAIGQDWDISVSFEPGDAIVYLFQTQETAAEFVLTCL